MLASDKSLASFQGQAKPISADWSDGTMYKVVGLLKRPEGMEMEDFRRWWLEVHAPKVMKWKGVTRYCVNLCTTDDQRYVG